LDKNDITKTSFLKLKQDFKDSNIKHQQSALRLPPALITLAVERIAV
jgi:hypothetical protein